MKALVARTRPYMLLALLLFTSGFSRDPLAAKRTVDSCDEYGWAAFQASLEKMHAGTGAMSGTRNADRNFIMLMLPHHQAAIEMAKTELLCGNDPSIRRLAQEIITDQQSEIDLMNLWLKQHESASGNPDK
jgi:uncharacterized protein (DUF305 family)